MKTVTIGIPAHNESSNIKRLLISLLAQKEIDFKLKKIFVISDGSTDNTVDEARFLKNSKITVIANKKRTGKNGVINSIITKTDSDILVLIDADCLPQNDKFLFKLIAGLNKPNVALSCAKPVPVKARGFVEGIINHSQKLKLSMNEVLAVTNPIYLGNGRALALAKKLYKKVSIPSNVIADDAYISLQCLKMGLTIDYARSAEILYRSPSTLHDHLNQSTRFLDGQIQLTTIFNKQFVLKAYSIPKDILIVSLLQGLVTSPINTMLYFFILLYSKFLVLSKGTENTHLWNQAKTSKSI